eukprot:scaffold9209_cov108-Skeletonema_dohrnii-CCMP3373.AAC.1
MSSELPTQSHQENFENAQELSTAATNKASESEASTNKNHNLSALAAQLQALQSEKRERENEIAHLKRQLKLLSEFKGFDIKGKELWESRGSNERSFITVLSTLEGAMIHNQRNYMPSGDDGGHSSNSNHPTSDDYNGNDLSESASSFNDKLLQNAANTPNKYEDYDETPFEAIAFLSPKTEKKEEE